MPSSNERQILISLRNMELLLSGFSSKLARLTVKVASHNQIGGSVSATKCGNDVVKLLF